MTRVCRALAWSLVLAALFAGTQTAPAARSPLRAGGYQVLAADFHVHSFPGDGGLAPWDLAVEADRRGLDAIALTNHNQRLSWQLTELIAPRPRGALLIPSLELTSAGYHMAAVGVTSVIPWRQPAAAAAAAVHAAGGVAIAAHPAGAEAAGYDDAFDVLDGYEAAHPLIYDLADGRQQLAAFGARAAARHPGIAAIGSTDFHMFAPLGLCRTFVFATERSIPAILDAVRAGRTVACDGSGQTYGPAHLAGFVADACRGAAAPVPTSAGERLGAVLLWLGLVLLVAAGPREPDLK